MDSCCMNFLCGYFYVEGALRMDVGISYIGQSMGVTIKTVVVAPTCPFGGYSTPVFTVVKLRKIKVLLIMLPQFADFKMHYTDAQHYALRFRIILVEN